MTLAAGSRLGPYEILAPIGAGGMGEVYKARDTRLERTVAVKVLPQHLSASPDSRQRFEREAKTISQLSHAHICALFDVGRENDTEYLVMEYLEGETLTDRLGKGALPLEQTLRYGTEIADALDKAHRQGIVHRDLKPGNVMITKAGVKLLDFGLAKAMAAPVQRSGMTSLPTVMGSGQNLTQEGTILGTFQYMSPEQLEGKEADARSDIFALGAVLYEVATGRKAFSGTSQASLISAIMKEDPPPVSSIQAMSPPALDRVVKTCLAKDPEDRWQSAHDVANELKWIAEGSQAGVPVKVASQRKTRELLAWVLAGLAAVAAAFLGVGYAGRAPRQEAFVRAQVPLGGLFLWDIALSPDGKSLAFAAGKQGGQPSLWIRNLGEDEAHPVAGVDLAYFPFWSPDGRSIAYFADGKLHRIDAAGGAAQTVCATEPFGLGGTWSRDGTIVFAPGPTSALFRVPASGGVPVPVTRLDASRHEIAHRYPHFLPDGRHFFYTTQSIRGDSTFEGSVRLGDLEGSTSKAVNAVYSAVQYVAGQLLYVREDSLLAQAFDPARLETRGEPVMIAPRVASLDDWSGSYAFSASGNALLLAPVAAVPSRLAWVDRSGRDLGSVGEPSVFDRVRLSPDGRRAAAAVLNVPNNEHEIRLFEAASGASTRFVFGAGDNFAPVWSPDGNRIFFATDRKKHRPVTDVWVKSLDGSSEEPYLDSPDQTVPRDWSSDGRYLAISKIPLVGNRNTELWVVNAADLPHQIPFARESPTQDHARFSADGKWIAFESTESGTVEIYVRAFPGAGGKKRVSAAGGREPAWRQDGRELYYVGVDNKMMAVPVSLAPTFQPGTPVPLFPIHPSPDGPVYDAAADGQKFLVATAPESAGSPPLSMLINWTALLKRGPASR
jgi:Tol biopolymer transport system component/predicted Ser/Thr protein kinase